jgi:isoleucyl-tRNA synthetase
MRRLREAVEKLSTKEVRAVEQGGSVMQEGVELKAEDLIISRITAPGAEASASSGKVTVVLDTALTPELRQEGLAREFVNRVQKTRKDLDFDVADRIVLRYMSANPNLLMAIDDFRAYVARETLAVDVAEVKSESELKSDSGKPVAHEIEGRAVVIALTRIQG